MPMFSFRNWARRPVAREHAAGYLRLTLLSFALTVALTRLFLSATGYPQLGSQTLHIAHLLWGGLALFVGALLMLIVVNRWAYVAGALLTGIGVGLFIDEVGKFITRTNDYFYPPAAPIIYTFFLLVLLLYLELRRPPARDARSELYRVFDDLQEVLDRDLDAHERAALKARLHHIVDKAAHPDLAHLAEELLHFVDSDSVYLIPHVPGWQERGITWLQTLADRRLTRRRLKAALVGGLGVLGVIAAINLVQWLLALQSPRDVTHMLADLVAVGRLGGMHSLVWLVLHIALKAASGLLLLASAGCFVLGRDKRGMQLGYLGLLLSLTVVDLMEFYFSQFSAIVPAAIQFGLLLIMLQYRRRYSNHPLFSGFSL
jgi:hypothetical protein